MADAHILLARIFSTAATAISVWPAFASVVSQQCLAGLVCTPPVGSSCETFDQTLLHAAVPLLHHVFSVWVKLCRSSTYTGKRCPPVLLPRVQLVGLGAMGKHASLCNSD